MSLEQSSNWKKVALLIGALALSDCGSRSDLGDPNLDPEYCANVTPEAGLCCKDNAEPDVEGIIGDTHTEHTPAELCELIAKRSEAVLCFFDGGEWDKFLYPWSDHTYIDKHGDTVYVSDAYGKEGLNGEMICSHSSYEDENGEQRENTDCDYYVPETGLEFFFFSGSQPKDYPEYAEAYGFVKVPEQDEYIDYAFYIDGKPEPDADYEANVPNVWLTGTEIDNLQYAACDDKFKDKITQFSSQIAGIAKKVVFKQ